MMILIWIYKVLFLSLKMIFYLLISMDNLIILLKMIVIVVVVLIHTLEDFFTIKVVV